MFWGFRLNLCYSCLTSIIRNPFQFQRRIEKDSTITSNRIFSNYGWISSGPDDLFTKIVSMCAWTIVGAIVNSDNLKSWKGRIGDEWSSYVRKTYVKMFPKTEADSSTLSVRTPFDFNTLFDFVRSEILFHACAKYFMVSVLKYDFIISSRLTECSNRKRSCSLEEIIILWSWADSICSPGMCTILPSSLCADLESRWRQYGYYVVDGTQSPRGLCLP